MSAHVSEETDQSTANERLDLSRFEGHTPGPWVLDNDEVKPLGVVLNEDTPDARLIAAAPDLLAALVGILSTRDNERVQSKRLRKENERLKEMIDGWSQ